MSTKVRKRLMKQAAARCLRWSIEIEPSIAEGGRLIRSLRNIPLSAVMKLTIISRTYELARWCRAATLYDCSARILRMVLPMRQPTIAWYLPSCPLVPLRKQFPGWDRVSSSDTAMNRLTNWWVVGSAAREGFFIFASSQGAAAAGSLV